MAALSDYAEDAVLNHLFRNTSMTSPTTVYLALFSAGTGLETNAPTSELSGSGYARAAITFGAPSSGAVQNSAQISIGAATADWSTVTHGAVMDASSAGNVLSHGQFTSPRDINNGETFIVEINGLTVSLD